MVFNRQFLQEKIQSLEQELAFYKNKLDGFDYETTHTKEYDNEI